MIIYIYTYIHTYIHNYMYNLTRVNPQVVNTNTLTLWSFSPSLVSPWELSWRDLSAGDADLVEVQAKMHQGLVVLQGHRQCLVTPWRNKCCPEKRAPYWGTPKKKTPPLFCAFYFCNHETNDKKNTYLLLEFVSVGFDFSILKNNKHGSTNQTLDFFTIPSRNFGLSISRGQSPM